MAIVVEDGTGIQLANSYASEDTFSNYCDDRAYTVASGDIEAALIRGTMYIDSYRYRFPGFRAKRRLQGLEWPRIAAFTRLSTAGRDLPFAVGRTDVLYEYMGISYIATNEIPIEIVQATCEAALRELAAPGSMAPDLARGGFVKSLKAGSVEIVYQDDADPNSTTQLIDNLLSGLLMDGSGGGMFGTAVRG